ncbi:MAG: endonuclease/exonuclease/phosphatase family protein [Muribaculaceae bacterium]|nr:endonuclease/exonuclease/phosphatase family protein [Muribaculaceae bacterium]
MKRILKLLVAMAAMSANAEDVTVLQWNIWQQGTMVPGGGKAIVDEIARLKPDFVTLSEVRNYQGVDYTAALVDSLRQRGLTYYSFPSYDTGILSAWAPVDTLTTIFPCVNDHGSVYRLVARKGDHEFAIYTAHLDYLDDAYYNVRGYDGSTWKECPIPTSVDEVLERNVKSRRDDATALFIAAADADRRAGRTVILGGDFNEPSHRDWTEATANMFDHHGLVIPWTVPLMLENAGMVDTYRTLYPNPVTHPGFTYPSDNPALPPRKITWAPKADERDRIDYIWVSPETGADIVSAEVFGPRTSIVRCERVAETGFDPFIEPLGVWPTDHKGLLVKLRLPDLNKQ